MLWVWLMRAANAFIGWVTGWFPEWVIPYPEPLTVVVPMPFGLGGPEMGTWLFFSLAVAGVLMVGRLLTWLYDKIPMI